jgi:hypothetical protein
MPDRRQVALGASATLAALAGGASAPMTTARLYTRLFNLRADISTAQTEEITGRLRATAEAAGLDGFLLGRNYNAQPFATRFEWLCMVQMGSARPADDPALAAFRAACDDLAIQCRSEARCEIDTALPARFADAAGVGLRHVVTFNFKPDASAEDIHRNVEAIREMGRLPMVRGYRVEPASPAATGPNQMQWEVIGDFASAADYKAYAEAPVHTSLFKDFAAHTSRVAFIDVAL